MHSTGIPCWDWWGADRSEVVARPTASSPGRPGSRLRQNKASRTAEKDTDPRPSPLRKPRMRVIARRSLPATYIAWAREDLCILTFTRVHVGIDTLSRLHSEGGKHLTVFMREGDQKKEKKQKKRRRPATSVFSCAREPSRQATPPTQLTKEEEMRQNSRLHLVKKAVLVPRPRPRPLISEASRPKPDSSLPCP